MNEPRPSRLSHDNIAEKVADVRETDDVYRVYRPEWVIVAVFTALQEGTPLQDAQRWFASHYEGRVRPEDVHFAPYQVGLRPEHVGAAECAVVQLQLRLPTLKGEWKYAFLAQRWADEQGFADASIVARNSKADHELRSYGVKRL